VRQKAPGHPGLSAFCPSPGGAMAKGMQRSKSHAVPVSTLGEFLLEISPGHCHGRLEKVLENLNAH